MRLVATEFQSDLSTLLPNLGVVSIRLNAVLSQPIKTSDCALQPNLVMSFDSTISSQAGLYFKEPMQYVVEPAFIITSGFNSYAFTLEKRLPIRTKENAFTDANQVSIVTFLSVIEVEVRRAIYTCLSVDKRCS